MGVSLRTARRNLGYRLNGLTVVRTGAEAVPDSGTFTGTASGSLSARRVVSSQLASLGLSGQSIRPDWYDDHWALVCTTVLAQRLVVPGSYVASSTVSAALTGSAAAAGLPVGYVLLDRDLTAAIPQGTEVELGNRLPPVRPEGNLPSITSILNDALAAISTVRTIVLTGNDDYAYDLSSYGLTRQSQLRWVLGTPYEVGLEAAPLQGGGQLDWDGNIPTLRVRKKVSSDYTFSIKVEVPAKRWVKVGSTWAASTVGYVNETDEADVDEDILTMVAHFHACLALSRPQLDGANQEWLGEAQRAADLAMPYMRWGQRTATQAPSPPAAPRYRTRLRGGRRWS